MPQKENSLSKALVGSKGSYNQIKETYRRAHLLGVNIADSVPDGNPKLKEKALDLKECRSWFELRHFPEFEGQRAESKVTKGFSCKNYRLCPACAMARSRKVYHSINEKVTALGLGQGDVYLFSVTIRNTPTFEAGIKLIRDFYKKLVQGRNDVKKGKSSIDFSPWAVVDGWIGHLETTTSKEGWHPHFHFLIAPRPEHKHLFEIDENLHLVHTDRGDKYYPKAGKKPRFTHEYGEKTGYFKSKFEVMMAKKLHDFCGSFMVDCRPLEMENEKDRVGGIAEASKYLFKFSELTSAEIWHVHEHTQGMRLAVCGGIFRGVELAPKDLNDEKEKDDDDRPWIDYMLKWFKTYYKDTIVDSNKLDLLPDHTMCTLDTIDFSNERREQNREYQKSQGMTVFFDFVFKNGKIVGSGAMPFVGGVELSEFLNENRDVYDDMIGDDVERLDFYDGTKYHAGGRIERLNYTS